MVITLQYIHWEIGILAIQQIIIQFKKYIMSSFCDLMLYYRYKNFEIKNNRQNFYWAKCTCLCGTCTCFQGTNPQCLPEGTMAAVLCRIYSSPASGFWIAWACLTSIYSGQASGCPYPPCTESTRSKVRHVINMHKYM